MGLRFGEFEFDPQSRELRSAGRSVALSPKAFALLDLLARSRPRALSRVEIREYLWPATFVSESNLNSLVAEIRRALGEDPRNPAWIRTVHGFGYAFSDPASPAGGIPSGESAPNVRFRLLCQDREVALRDGENLLGRTDESTVWIDAPTISRRHARIVVSRGRATLEDLGSRNGTWLRGQRIDSPCPLEDGDEIRLGRVPVTFRRLHSVSTSVDSAP